MQDEVRGAAALQQGGQRGAWVRIETRRCVAAAVAAEARVGVVGQDGNNGRIDGRTQAAAHAPQTHHLNALGLKQQKSWWWQGKQQQKQQQKQKQKQYIAEGQLLADAQQQRRVKLAQHCLVTQQ